MILLESLCTMNTPSTDSKSKNYKPLWLALHYIIITHFVVEILYCAYMVFIVLQPEGGGGPLMDRALKIPFEHMVTRRLYAIECWIATGALAIYLAITELLPRQRVTMMDYS